MKLLKLMQKQPLDNIKDILDYISVVKHAHIDYPRKFDRFFPAPGDDFDYLPYFKALHDAKYQGILTVEATIVKDNFLHKATACLEFLKQLEAAAAK